MWRLEFDRDAAKALKKLDRPLAKRILRALNDLRALDDPTRRCKALSGPLSGLWRLRIGDYRAILDVQRNQLTIVALDIGNRSTIYDH